MNKVSNWNEFSRARTGERIFGADFKTEEDIPAGGWAQCGEPISHGNNNMAGLLIRWQDGPIDRNKNERPNGASVEDVLQCVKRRLTFFQTTPTACEENEIAIEAIEEAIQEMEKRRDRMKQPKATDGFHDHEKVFDDTDK